MKSVEARSKQLHFIALLHIPPHQIQPLVSRINILYKITPLVEFLLGTFQGFDTLFYSERVLVMCQAETGAASCNFKATSYKTRESAFDSKNWKVSYFLYSNEECFDCVFLLK